jgi:hypothetical protein
VAAITRFVETSTRPPAYKFFRLCRPWPAGLAKGVPRRRLVPGLLDPSAC